MSGWIRGGARLFVVFVVAALVACGGGAGGGASGETSNPPLTGNFSPLAVGDRWYYGSGTDPSETRVIGTRQTANGTAFVVRTTDADGASDDLVQMDATGIYSEAADNSSPTLTALGRVQMLRLPLVVGDSYETVNRTLNNVEDFDDDGRLDSLRFVARVVVVGVESATVGGTVLTGVARVRTELTLTFILSGRPLPLVVISITEELRAPGIGVVSESSTVRSEGQAPVLSNSSLTIWRVGGRASETTAPTVLSITPADGSRIQVPTLRVTFSEDMDTFSTDNALALRDASGNAVAAVVRWLSDRELELQPSQPLADGAWQASLGAGVQDRAGNVLASQPLWRLTTDATAPRLAQRTPAPGSINVAAGTAIRVVFDEALVNPLAQPGLLFLTTEAGALIAGGVVLEGDRTLVYTSTSPLPPGERITVNLGTVSDVLGNVYSGDRWTFDLDPGSFAAPAPLPLGFGYQGNSNRLLALDSDGDGRAELLTSGGDPGTTFSEALYRTRWGANGTWATVERLQALESNCTTTGLALADIDGDGVRDVVVSSEAGFTASCGLHWLRGLAGGGYAAARLLHLGNGGAVRVVPNRADGRPMLVMPLDDERLLVLRQSTASGVWDAPQYLSTSAGAGPGPYNRSVATGDVNGDGRVDVVLFAQQKNSDYAAGHRFMQQADGSLSAAVLFTPPGAGAGLPFDLSDTNGDGRADLAFVTLSGDLYLAAGRADGTFDAVLTRLPDAFITTLSFADINGDGRPDLVYSVHSQGIRAMLAQAQAQGGFAAPVMLTSREAGWNRGALTMADLNGDGLLDILVGEVWLRQRVPAVSSSATPTAAPRAQTATAAASATAAGTQPATGGAKPLLLRVGALMRNSLAMGRRLPPVQGALTH